MFSLLRGLAIVSLSVVMALVLAVSTASTQSGATRGSRLSPQRKAALIARYNHYRDQAIRIQNRYRAVKAWCTKNWRSSHTPVYHRYQAELKKLEIRYNWARHHMRQAEAEYHGRQGGWVFVLPDSQPGSTAPTPSTSRSIKIFGITPSGGSVAPSRTTTRSTPATTRTTRPTRTTRTPIRTPSTGTRSTPVPTGLPQGGLLGVKVKKPVQSFWTGPNRR